MKGYESAGRLLLLYEKTVFESRNIQMTRQYAGGREIESTAMGGEIRQAFSN